MRAIPSFLLLVVLVFFVDSLPAQQVEKPSFTPPRLRITTVAAKNGGDIKVQAVSPGGLGDQFGLKAGNVIMSLHVDDLDEAPMNVNSTTDLFRWLDKVGKATKNKDQACTVKLSFQTDKGSEEVKGKVYRLNASDSKDGGTLYYFKKMDPK